MKMKILFICKHNRFRSKVAEAIFKELNKDRKITAESAGVHLDKKRNYIAAAVKRIARKKGYIIKGSSKKLTDKKLREAELIVIAASNISSKEIKGFKGKILKWRISDCNQKDERGIGKRIEQIEGRVRRLVEKMRQLLISKNR